MNLKHQVAIDFKEHYGCDPVFIIRAPGRVNLIGEHTDYNDGFVMPMAIERAVWFALEPTHTRHVELYSLDKGSGITFSLDGISFSQRAALSGNKTEWGEYIKGVAWALIDAGYCLTGLRGVLRSDVPIGAGLSSSAALELATARAFFEVSEEWTDWDPSVLAKVCQKAENQWVGVNCGIMDQLIVSVGLRDCAVLIDCRSLALAPTPLPEGASVIILDTGTRRGLDGSAYNERLAQCEAASAYFGVPALRDVSVELFEKKADGLDPLVCKRARHVITENERTIRAAAAMVKGNLSKLGRLMTASHQSLRDDFEVSCEALDVMVEVSLEHNACFGARMTGAGFGGCAVALVKSELTDAFVESVSKAYPLRQGIEPQIYVTRPSEGTAVIAANSLEMRG